MTLEIYLCGKPVNKAALIKRMVLGASIALSLMILFLWGVEGRPEWPEFWKLRPYLVILFAGSVGGACFYFLDHISPKGGWKIAAYFFSFLIYLFGLWMGTVLGLVGTLWH